MLNSRRVGIACLLLSALPLVMSGCEDSAGPAAFSPPSLIGAPSPTPTTPPSSEFAPIPRDGLDEPYELEQVAAAETALGQAAQAALVGHDDDTAEARAALMAAAARQVPGVLSVTVSRTFSVGVLLKDGTAFALLPPRPGTQGTEPPAPPETVASPTPTTENSPIARFTLDANAKAMSSARVAGPEYLLNSSKKAVLVDVEGLGSFSTAFLANAFRKKNYALTTSTGSLNDLRTLVRDVGAFWFSSHSTETDIEVGGRTYTFFMIQAGQATDSNLNCAPGPDLAACQLNRRDEMGGSLIRASADGGKNWRWFITRGFVLKYWSFPPESAVVLDICSTMDSGDPSAKLRENLRQVGAHTILGWSNVVTAIGAVPVMKRLFDRVLGNNDYVNPTPKQRPFSFEEVHAYMVGQGMDQDANGSARLKLESKDANKVILVPSIRSMAVDEKEELLTLRGEFGKTEKPLSIAGKPLAIASWTSREVIARLPRTGAGSYGDTLIDADGRQSNHVPLTRWQGTMRQYMVYSGMYGTPGPTSDFRCTKLTLRSDIHRYRELPGQPLLSGQYGMNKAYFPEASRDSSCGLTVGSQGTMDLCRFVFHAAPATVPWSSNLPEDVGLGSNDNWWLFVGNLNLNSREFRFFINDHVFFKMQVWCKTSPTGPETLLSDNQMASLFAANGTSDHYSNVFPRTVTQDWSLPSTSVSVPDLNGMTNQRTLEYDMPAVAIPTDDTES